MTYEELYRKISAHAETNQCECLAEFEKEAVDGSFVDALQVPSQITSYWLRTIESFACDE